MKSLPSRKQLLLAESELNRAQLAGDMTALAADVRAVTARAKSVFLIASSVAALWAGLAAIRRKKAATGGAKPSMLQTVLNGAGLVSSLWMAFHPQRHDQDQPSGTD
jgi:hypothetical protein